MWSIKQNATPLFQVLQTQFPQKNGCILFRSKSLHLYVFLSHACWCIRHGVYLKSNQSSGNKIIITQEVSVVTEKGITPQIEVLSFEVLSCDAFHNAFSVQMPFNFLRTDFPETFVWLAFANNNALLSEQR